MSWFVACLAYFVCEPIIGTVTFPVGVIFAKTAAFINLLDKNENVLGGRSFEIFFSLQAMAWVALFYGQFIIE